MARLYHPALGREIEIPDDEGCIAVHADSGWLPAPDLEPTPPGIVPEPIVYAPVIPQASKSKRSAKTEDPAPD